MALREKLVNFNKRQAELAATAPKPARTSSAQAAQSKASASRKLPQLTPPAQPQLPFAQRFSFTNDTEKLQQIATIRKSPVGAQIKRVLGVLLETRQALLAEEINDLCYVDVKGNKEVLESLKSNVKVSFDGQRFTYKSKHELKDKLDLLKLVRRLTEGIPVGDLKDSYPGVLSDVQELKVAGEVWILTNSDSQDEMIYPNDPKIQIEVDDDVKQLIRSIEMPREFMDVERELMKAGMKPATNSARRDEISGIPRSQQKPKQKPKRRDSKRTKYTNAHLPELFSKFQVP
eukprot:TRINITY_DN2386_c0_g2_i1.p2 TRINITY_DN2386_c0_g2~~TRINITY_DN2386_c0_g2_i1.p2  ORF type:complete len:289 (+),score=65.11 TRINITY_DN2386_c0_g2_i1:53-919(+)